jgi:hypothetical protein
MAHAQSYCGKDRQRWPSREGGLWGRGYNTLYELNFSESWPAIIIYSLTWLSMWRSDFSTSTLTGQNLILF